MDLDTLQTHVQLEPWHDEHRPLEEVIATHYDVPETHVRVAKSSLLLLQGVLALAPEPVLVPVPDYFEYPEMCRSAGKEARLYQRLSTYEPALASEATVLLSNPNNPTGTVHDLRHLLNHCMERKSLLIVDEAYMEFAREQYSLAPLVKEYDNLVVLRTMSKLYGLTKPGKVGYALGHPSLLDWIVVQDATLEARRRAASLLGHPCVVSAANDVAIRRQLLVQHLEHHNCVVAPSTTNFVMARGRGFSLYETLHSVNVQAVSLDETPGLEGEGMVRIAVPSHAGMAVLKQRWP